MAITYPLAFPTVRGVMSLTWRAVRVDIASTSPFSLSQQVQRHTGQAWAADLTMPPLERAEAEEFNAFALKLDGRYGTFTLVPPDGATPRGSAGVTPGTPVVNGAAQTGNELAIDGCPVSVTGYLKAGDYIQLGAAATTRLYKVLDDVNTTAGGAATLTIWPNLRTSPANNETVVVSGAAGLFRMASPEADWQVEPGTIYGRTFSIMEAL